MIFAHDVRDRDGILALYRDLDPERDRCWFYMPIDHDEAIVEIRQQVAPGLACDSLSVR